ncbi:hypothetical protein M3Y94_00261700 [Aphelenchoides besseyi]|nr:hypothetical protein M3Y94_00261700 [Aphelenchoides besseyi]KAI6236166.1 hypothetical protein M3Y95_00128800 [Aphelenchoides besseyi]
MDPEPSKTCLNCHQAVFPRDLKSDGTCKSCYRKAYYQSRKEILAARYKENREERLLKQKQYYLNKRERLKSSDEKPTKKRRQKEPTNRSYSTVEYNKQEIHGVVAQQSSSEGIVRENELDVSNGTSTLVKVNYPFEQSDGVAVATTQQLSFIVTPNMLSGEQTYVWEPIEHGRL